MIMEDGPIWWKPATILFQGDDVNYEFALSFILFITKSWQSIPLEVFLGG